METSSQHPASRRRGDQGAAVRQIGDLLVRLGLLGEGREAFDESMEVAVRTFQQQRGLSVDGIVGPSTYRRLEESRWSLGDRILNHRPGGLTAGDDVYQLQHRLLSLGFKLGRIDGYFGPRTEAALKEFQAGVGVPVDGTCGPATLKALGRLSPIVSGGAPNAMRAEDRIREAGPVLAGKVVVLDPTVPPGWTLPESAEAATVVHDVARRVEGRLVATGVQALLASSPLSPSRDESERAAFANRTGAHVSVSIGVDRSPSPDAAGVSTYFFGSAGNGAWSSTGERLAGLVQREIVARTDLADLRCHAKTWDFLRATRMPAIRVFLGYLSNGADRARLCDAGFRDVVADAIAVAVQRFYLSPDSDARTGFLRFADLQAGLATSASG